jgi:hypothetical protein
MCALRAKDSFAKSIPYHPNDLSQLKLEPAQVEDFSSNVILFAIFAQELRHGVLHSISITDEDKLKGMCRSNFLRQWSVIRSGGNNDLKT